MDMTEIALVEHASMHLEHPIHSIPSLSTGFPRSSAMKFPFRQAETQERQPTQIAVLIFTPNATGLWPKNTF
jgi:hypothetical protein